MKSLEEQMKDEDKEPSDIVRDVLNLLGIDERGGGPEGIYYTSPSIEGEYLYRNLSVLIQQRLT